jgi:hypothetical protein
LSHSKAFGIPLLAQSVMNLNKLQKVDNQCRAFKAEGHFGLILIAPKELNQNLADAMDLF